MNFGNFILIIILGIFMEMYYYFKTRKFIYDKCKNKYDKIMYFRKIKKFDSQDVISKLSEQSYISTIKKVHIYHVYEIIVSKNKLEEYIYCVEYRENDLVRRYAMVKGI